MATPSSLPLSPVSVQKSVIEFVLGQQLFYDLLTGARRSVQHRRIVIFIITMLYMAYILDYIIWRCFRIWDDSLRAILLPLVFLAVQIDMSTGEALMIPITTHKGANIFVIIEASVEHLNPSRHQARILDSFLFLGMIATFLCTLTTTIIIIRRIYPIAHQEGGLRSSTQRFKHILDIIIQSAALYSVTSLAFAITSVIPVDNTKNLTIAMAQGYSYQIFAFIADVSPTLMVARIILSANDDSINHQLTCIDFQRQPIKSVVIHSESSEGNSLAFHQDVEKEA
ncbi:hypothetical protein CVT25_001791 [Psilocybe cyanescens]|uniref:G-protein coupled receptors family 1 profile domain-containing protein n=1 Tax=Psilocybe cyanescens TaxID=93625 RepID=A0A409WPP4_PSICY|nr:hypothetical protein CVT25_001791 [Psilocybe cyanescens]